MPSIKTKTIAVSKSSNPVWPDDFTLLPSCKRGVEIKVSTLVDSGRNVQGVVVGQKIGRDQFKISNLEWAMLTADQWAEILNLFEPQFYVRARIPDPRTPGEFVTLKMYPGDRDAEPYYIDPETGAPTMYINCKVNLIDTGA